MGKEDNIYNQHGHYLFSVKTYIAAVLVCGLGILGYLSATYGVLYALILGMLPVGVVFACLCLKRPIEGYYAFFILNYFIMGLSRYAVGSTFPFGVVIDGFIAYLALILVINTIFNRESVPWKNVNNGFTLLSLVWLIYCCFQLFNPHGVPSAWSAYIRGIAFYMFAISFIAPLIIRKFRDLRVLMFIWSVLTLLGALKAILQRFVGFDFAESYWLFVEGGGITHVIGYGVRYFSFFTDAANFGASMAMSMTVFSIYMLYEKKTSIKIWFGIVSVFAFYGILLSGTRAAVAIPFVGYAVLVLLSKKPKLIIIFSSLILFVFCFLNFTHWGNGNATVQRMRSALDPNDPSMMVRYQNQEKLKVYMADKPLGVGLGLSGVKAKKYTPGSYLSTIPTDSWFVMLWVETGVTGLFLNLAILFYVLVYGFYQVLFKLKNDVLKGLYISLLAGNSGMIMASYANEILGQFPNGIIIYTAMAMIFMGPKFDKELSEANHES